MSPGKDFNSHDLEQCIYLMACLSAIRQETGFGSIEFDIKDNKVVFRKKTVREHPKT